MMHTATTSQGGKPLSSTRRSVIRFFKDVWTSQRKEKFSWVASKLEGMLMTDKQFGLSSGWWYSAPTVTEVTVL